MIRVPPVDFQISIIPSSARDPAKKTVKFRELNPEGAVLYRCVERPVSVRNALAQTFSRTGLFTPRIDAH
jgi:hypothetical protein